MKIYCSNLGRYIPIDGGTSLRDLAVSLRDELPFEPICARVNNKTESLEYEIYHPKQIEFLDITSSSGARVYLRSLCMILYRALMETAPQYSLRMEHSISRGYYCRIDGMAPTADNARRISEAMQRLIDQDLPFVREEKLTSDVIPMFEAQGLHAKAELLRTTRTLYTTYYTLDGICDSYYGALAVRTGIIRSFALQPYHEGFLLMSFDPARPDTPATPIPQEKMYAAFTDYLRFNDIIGVQNVGRLNSVINNKQTSDIINVAEALHEKSISHIADDIAARYERGGARIVLIAGPSSSGKTTATKRLAIQLMTRLMKPQMISLDDYFVDRHHTPRDEDGEYDYESLYALDLPLFNSDLQRALAGEVVDLPTYNFETGMREYRGNKIHITEGSILLIEGIHGLNPELTARIPEEMKYRLYVSALTTLSIDFHNWVPTTDTRLLRRLVRDAKYRGITAEDTIRRWPSVRRGEEKWIFPYQENADAMFNSSFVFELAVMKEYGEDILSSVPSDVPEYAEAYRLRKFLSYFKPIDSSLLPSTSLLREFLGGSSFKY